ncbi:hypothetical protein R6Q57_017732 [Mikania cordata]
MAAPFTTPPVKKSNTGFQPRKGKIKAQIFGGIAESVASAASRARDFFGLVKNDDNTSSPATPPLSSEPVVDPDGEDSRAVVNFMILEKDP